jgi:hypothetical protein
VSDDLTASSCSVGSRASTPRCVPRVSVGDWWICNCSGSVERLT